MKKFVFTAADVLRAFSLFSDRQDPDNRVIARAEKLLSEDRPTFEIFTASVAGQAITCHLCGMTSHNPNDVRETYCGRCRVFHKDLPLIVHVMVPTITQAEAQGQQGGRQ